MAIAGGLERIFEIGPVFRAENSNTNRHATEFMMVDMEFSCVDSHEDVMVMEEKWLHHVLSEVALKHGDAIKETFGIKMIL